MLHFDCVKMQSALVLYLCLIVAHSGDVGSSRRDAHTTLKVVPKISRSISFESNEVVEGSPAVATCVIVNGDVPITFTWLKNGMQLQAGQDTLIQKTSEYASKLTLRRTQMLHSGTYTCVAKNSVGEDRGNLQLIVTASARPPISSAKGAPSGRPSTSETIKPRSDGNVEQERLQVEKDRWAMEKRVFELQIQKLQLEVDCMSKNRGFCNRQN